VRRWEAEKVGELEVGSGNDWKSEVGMRKAEKKEDGRRKDPVTGCWVRGCEFMGKGQSA
jgi:hypothetical protein